MSSFEVIKQKLEAFIRKYYTNELIKGAILFFAIGFLYFLLTLFIEHVLWLKPIGRTILFVFFILIETLLFSIFIVLPLAKLFRLRRGLNFVNASKIIGNHFPEVSDKLLNVLQLERESNQSELLLASIEQKSNELKPIPFKLAINFKKNVKYLKYAAIPILIIGLSYITGKINWFSDSYERVVNYQTAYEPPAPFQFYVVNETLEAIENKDFKVLVVTEGTLIPEEATINFNNETYFLKQVASNQFEYVFSKPKSDITFNLQSNDVISKDYEIKILETPTLQGFEMVLDYPSHTNKKDEVVKNNGNAIVPHGTRITWNINTKSTDNVSFAEQDSVYQFKGKNNQFNFSKRLFNSTNYSVTTSNNNVENYERLSYSIDVIKDEFPELNVQMKRDSTDIETLYFYGRASDDYGIKSLKLVYYPVSDIQNTNSLNIPISNSTFDEFYNVFPNNINLIDGESYVLYYEATDNDAVSGFKTTRSKEFAYKKLTKEEIEDSQLQEQNETIEDLNKSFDKLEEQDEELKEISKNQKEKSELNFNDKKKLENFLKRQREQEELMKNYNKKLKENLENFKDENPEEDKFKEELKERLQDNEEQLKKDEELLKELEKYADKLKKEELSQKLEELAKQNKNKKRSLEQLLELTKRYYVSQKTEQLKEELNQLAEEQEKLSEESEEKNTKEKQDELNKKFEDFQKELEDLRKENDKLRNPMDVPNDKKAEEDIKKDQKEASENLEQKEESPQDSEQQQNAQKMLKRTKRKLLKK